MVERTMFENKKSPCFNFFEDGGVGEESFLFKESFFPHVKKTLISINRSFATDIFRSGVCAGYICFAYSIN